MTTERLRVLVLEDEWVARNFLVELIEASKLAEVVGAVGTLDDADEFLATANGTGSAVDIVFVDVNLAGSRGTGLDFVREQVAKAGGVQPLFVLATAMREHALLAFDLGIADYLTKPFSKDRVTQCLTRLAAKRVPDEAAPASSAAPQRIVARKKRSLIFLEASDVWAFESQDRLVVVHSAHGTFDIDLSLAAVELSFGKQFLRVHRNWLVSTDHIRELERDSGETTLIVGAGYQDGEKSVRVPVARERTQIVKEQLTAGSPGIRKR
jgi:two-component system, LytTR family, response regulator LytT